MRAYWFSQWNTQPGRVDVLQFHPVSMVSILKGFLLRVARIRSIDGAFSQVSGWTSGLDVNKSLEGVKYPISLHIAKLPIANEQTMRILDFQRWIPWSAFYCSTSNVDTITKIYIVQTSKNYCHIHVHAPSYGTVCPRSHVHFYIPR